MLSWRKHLPYDPLPLLLESGCAPVAYFARCDLLGDNPGPVERLWDLPDAQKILRHQMKNGGWRYPSPANTARSAEDYDQIETYRNLGFLVEKFGFTRAHPAVQKAAEFLFSSQTSSGDFRGIYGTQYSPNYSAGIMELLIKAGFERDARLTRGLRWLLSMRQADGGWAIPLRTRATSGKWTDVMRAKTIEPDHAKPFSHMVTGVVLRAFAATDHYSDNEDVRKAGELLASRLFRSDAYIDRKAPSFWVGFSFPFWFTDLLSALDTLSRLGFPAEDPNIRRGLDWIAQRQRKDGGWTLKLLKGADKALPYWLDLAVCRIFKQFATTRRYKRGLKKCTRISRKSADCTEGPKYRRIFSKDVPRNPQSPRNPRTSYSKLRTYKDSIYPNPSSSNPSSFPFGKGGRGRGDGVRSPSSRLFDATPGGGPG